MGTDLEIYMDHVILFGQRIDRPSRMARSVWMRFWEERQWI